MPSSLSKQVVVALFAVLASNSSMNAVAAEKGTVRVVREVKGSAESKPLYVANRAPLHPSPFVKLPIGSIEPRGWLRHQLELERDGMIGHLKEISPWLNFERSAWGNPRGEGERGWEELPYWLKGYGDLGYVLKDEKIIAEAKKWIESAMSSQREDGWFGPRALLTSLDAKPGIPGKPDLWPNMVMLNIFQTYHEFSGDKRVLDVMTRYFKWQDQLPANAFGAGYWPKIRAGDNIESIFWLYNRTGESWLLPLGKKIHDNMARWDEGVINWHNVNIAQGFREPGVFWMQSRDPKHLAAAEQNYQTVMDKFGQFPGGGFGGDENCREGFYDPRQGFETCGIVEFMHSFEMLTKISGNPIWSDRCEDIAFNSFPASMTPDQKGLRYLTCANQIQADKNNKAPLIENGGTMFSYSPFEVYRCCQHNVSHGWPYYAEELWLATHDGGLCASLYAESEVRAKIGDGAEVRITESTDYPFGDEVKLKIAASKAVQFPLYLRVPRWCDEPTVNVNGRKVSVKATPLSYVVVNRAWKDGDTVTLTLPMRVTVSRWAQNQNAASVNYGPLTFALGIGEDWKRYGKNENWPEWEVFPTSAWNYGLMFDEKKPARSFRVEQRKSASIRKGAVSLKETGTPISLSPAEGERAGVRGQSASLSPFTPETTPVVLKAKAKKIPNWQADKFGMVGKLQPSPMQSDERIETVTLIPMGSARLRISAFPVIGSGKNAREWEPPKVSAIHASHVFANDSVEAVNDGKEPTSSSDTRMPRFTWWDHRGTTEWIEWGFPKTRKVSAVEVYWYDDTGKGSVRAPQSWRVLYRVGERWAPVQTGVAGYGTELNKYNRVTFTPVECNGVRIEAELQPNFSAGILEWKVE